MKESQKNVIYKISRHKKIEKQELRYKNVDDISMPRVSVRQGLKNISLCVLPRRILEDRSSKVKKTGEFLETV